MWLGWLIEQVLQDFFFFFFFFRFKVETFSIPAYPGMHAAEQQ